ncbi:MAG: hypothetical protein M3N16_02875 [Actinomycetota bacterium]|nr:hypothetical protein [Actinomycetota bacterium]
MERRSTDHHRRQAQHSIELLNRGWRKVGGSTRIDRCLACGLNVPPGERAVQVQGHVLHANCAAR